jgi:hypothetical protein
VINTGVAVGATTSGGGVAVAAGAAGAGVGVKMIIPGVLCGVGWATATVAFAVGAGVVLGSNVMLGIGVAVGACEGECEGCGELDCSGVGEDVGANVALTPGSGVKLGAGVGACEPPVPKNFVSRPPSNKPPKMTSTMSGTIGIPPRLGGSGSRRRRRG